MLSSPLLHTTQYYYQWCVKGKESTPDWHVHLLVDLCVHLKQVLSAVSVGGGKEVGEESLDKGEHQDVPHCRLHDVMSTS